jgi:hypothetical protein
MRPYLIRYSISRHNKTRLGQATWGVLADGMVYFLDLELTQNQMTVRIRKHSWDESHPQTFHVGAELGLADLLEQAMLVRDPDAVGIWLRAMHAKYPLQQSWFPIVLRCFDAS